MKEENRPLVADQPVELEKYPIEIQDFSNKIDMRKTVKIYADLARKSRLKFVQCFSEME